MGLTIVEQVIWAIADAENTDPAELEYALQDFVETDAIRMLVNHDSDSCHLQFQVPNHTVTVTCDETVCVDGKPAPISA